MTIAMREKMIVLTWLIVSVEKSITKFDPFRIWDENWIFKKISAIKFFVVEKQKKFELFAMSFPNSFSLLTI